LFSQRLRTFAFFVPLLRKQGLPPVTLVGM
jgi:hypothetical protein